MAAQLPPPGVTSLRRRGVQLGNGGLSQAQGGASTMPSQGRFCLPPALRSYDLIVVSLPTMDRVEGTTDYTDYTEKNLMNISVASVAISISVVKIVTNYQKISLTCIPGLPHADFFCALWLVNDHCKV